MTKPTRARLEIALKSEVSLRKEAVEISKDMQNGMYDIADLAEQLGFALTSQDVNARVAGTNLLSKVLIDFPTDILTEMQLKFLTTFYVDRLRDHHNFMPAIIDALGALLNMTNMSGELVLLILQAFFQHTTCQSQARGDRTKLFMIFKHLTLHFQKELQTMAGDFLYGLINSIDGERDPRNLDIIFSFMPGFISKYDLLHLAEEMFEIFACYFPIDFYSSKQDATGITREDLAAKLINCLVATPIFAEWTVVLAVEKLESDLIVAKLDSIQLLHQAALQFPADVLEPHFEQIWQSLKTETFPGGDNAYIVNAALKALAVLLEGAMRVPRISHSYQSTILSVVLNNLTDVNQRLFHPATAIALVCLASDPLYAADKILSCFLMKLQTTTSDLPNHVFRKQRIKLYHSLAQVYKVVSLRHTLDILEKRINLALQSDVIDSLRQFEQKGFDVKQLDLQLAALSVLVECASSLSEVQRVLIYKTLVQLISHDHIDIAFTDLTIQLGTLYPIEMHLNLVDVCIRNFEIFSNFIKRKIYSNLLPLLPQKAFTQVILDFVMRQVFQSSSSEHVRILALEALNTLLQKEDSKFVVELQQNSNLIHQLIELAQSTDNSSLEALELIAAGLSRIVHHLPVSEQYVIVTEYLPSQLQTATDLYLAKGILGYLKEDVSLDDDFEGLLQDLKQLSLTTHNDLLRATSHHLLCSLVNKIEYTKRNLGKLQLVIKQLKDTIAAGEVRAVEILAWITKGLIVSGYLEAADIVGYIAELLDHPTLSHAAALAFDIIPAEYPELDLPVVKYLYKQKFFHTVLNKLGGNLNSNCVHRLKAFIYVLKATPHAVLRLNIEKLGPLLFKSLEHTEEQTLCVALAICENFVNQQDAYFQANIEDLIHNCLALSKYKEHHTMQIRISALQLLHDVTKYPTYALLPYKLDVTIALAAALDDPKRLVRNRAVKARNAWYLIGAPNGD